MKSVPSTVWALGIVSLLMDLSSELVHALLPVYMTVVLGASMVAGGRHRRSERWSAYGASWTFYAGAVFTSIALLGLLLAGWPRGSGEKAPPQS